ncbi:MAG: threonylcarbamoyl-AMP synthase [Alphaproteobacteria bacterium]|nr:threonylcarbamoyl-AMP synthase [Alphaproteobacteria bacterium]
MAARLIRAGELAAFPTETVYGLGADATNDRAVARLFAAKDRPRFNPLIVHLPDVEAARALARFDGRAERLAARFWPGPLTLVLPRLAACPVSLLASAGLDTLALRVPAHPIAHRLLVLAATPVAAPSANRSGAVSPTLASHVAESLGDRVALILDGGATPIGIESTVLDLSQEPAALLRPGGVTIEAIEALLGPIEGPPATGEGPFKSPGMLARHYAPTRPLRLLAQDARPGEALLAFGPHPPTGARYIANLSPTGDVGEAAANLFAMLRALDRPDVAGIAAMAVPEVGLGRAINDRLRRAARR